MNEFYISNGELYHYGMPRRSGRYPWGSGDRPYQSVDFKSMKQALKGRSRGPQFKEARAIPKGTILYRTTTNPNEETKGTSYVTYMGPERDLYKGGYIRLRDESAKSYEKSFELKEDLKLPSRDHVKDTILDLIKEDSSLLDESLRSYYEILYPEGSMRRAYLSWDENIGGPSAEKWNRLVERSLETVKNKPLEDSYTKFVVSLGKSDKLKEKLISSLQEEGYNAMADDASVGGFDNFSIEGIDPLIVFDMSSSASPIKTKEISTREEIKSQNNYRRWVNKARSNNAGKEW